MFPLQQSSELCFKISSDPYQENTIPQHDLIQLGLAQSSDPTCTHQMEKSRHKSSSTTTTTTTNHHDNTKKKMIHREIERQRRQEMAAGCASLRSLLPLEYIKGKRSISDHMNEAVNYIKHLQKSISVLGDKRDELRKLSDLRGNLVSVELKSDERSSSYSPCHVMVRPMADGIEVLLNCGLISSLREQDFPLSRVLQIVQQQGLSVASCSSTKVNHRLLHTIQSEVSDPNTNCNIDSAELQQKLAEAILEWSSRFSSTH